MLRKFCRAKVADVHVPLPSRGVHARFWAVSKNQPEGIWAMVMRYVQHPQPASGELLVYHGTKKIITNEVKDGNRNLMECTRPISNPRSTIWLTVWLEYIPQLSIFLHILADASEHRDSIDIPQSLLHEPPRTGTQHVQWMRRVG